VAEDGPGVRFGETASPIDLLIEAPLLDRQTAAGYVQAPTGDEELSSPDRLSDVRVSAAGIERLGPSDDAVTICSPHALYPSAKSAI
jgi:hypothetical protein